ncbi:MAG: GatB/YqeY domain-containing protein [Chloroflexi bacterium]|nr:GatB/YqeY domain-containing protein [Chloroflexota bacterium]
MSKKNELEAALKTAMKASDVVQKNTLRLALSAVKEAEVLKQAELDNAAVIGILQKEVKSRQETIAEAEKAERNDLVGGAKAEIVVLEGFLPQQMDDAELEKLVDAAIAESGANAISDMGNVMKLVLPNVAGRADGGKVSQLVRQKLQGG